MASENDVELQYEKTDTDTPEHIKLLDELDRKMKEQMEKDKEYRDQIKEGYSQLFDHWESGEFAPNDFKIDIPVNSLESRVGFSSLVRQLHDSFTRTIAFYRSNAGGALPPNEARERAFHRCENTEEAKKIFNDVMSYPHENISFDSLHRLYGYAPRVAERLWETI